MKTTIFNIRDKEFVLYPEYAFSNADEAVAESKKKDSKDKIIIVGIGEEKRVLTVFLENGDVLYAREKAKYTTAEKERGCVEPTPVPIMPFVYNQTPYAIPIVVLPVLCYELCFPELTMGNSTPDAVVHHIGFPMFDKHQYKAWVALERSLGIMYNCPVYVSTGDNNNSDLAIQGRVY